MKNIFRVLLDTGGMMDMNDDSRYGYEVVSFLPPSMRDKERKKFRLGFIRTIFNVFRVQ